MTFIRSCLLATVCLAIALTFIGCSKSSSSSPRSTSRSATPYSPSPTGGAVASAPILAPFQGHWKIDEPKTIALWKSQGMTGQDLVLTQSMLQKMNMPLHPDLVISGNTGILPYTGMRAGVEGEYLFYALHTEGPAATPGISQIVCGKAWHHEDRHDPGDMSKCLTRLQLKDGSLYLSTRDAEDAADPADPEVTTMPLTAGSAATCTADKAPQPAWSPWTTFIFSRAD